MNMQAQSGSPAAPVSLFALYRVFFWIGVFSFGGGLMSWIHREIVEVRGWMTREQFLSGYAVAQILPGVSSTNMAIFVGQRLRGGIGAATALAATLTAPLALVLAAAASYDLLLSIPAITVALAGVAAAATGMLVRTGIVSAGPTLRRASAGLVMVATFVIVGVLQWPVLPVLAAIIPLSVAAAWPKTKWPGTRLGA